MPNTALLSMAKQIDDLALEALQQLLVDRARRVLASPPLRCVLGQCAHPDHKGVRILEYRA